ncbi:MAG TPA: glycoside hydrolase family 9 protein [Bacteroidales bacterium]|nr:glycoside hydrolase family 9 protein [Bacteroidales bacterium]
MKTKPFFLWLLPALCLFSCNNGKNAESAGDEKILVAQNGYVTGWNKTAIIRVPADSFYLADINGKICYRGKPGEKKHWSFSDEWVQVADFSSIDQPGDYTIILVGKGIGKSAVIRKITILADPFKEIANAGVKALYFNRCSYPILPPWGGKWVRGAGHTDTTVYVHQSAASGNRPEGFVISGKGGWYDAGDYNKYIVNSGITTYTMLLAYEMYSEYWQSQNLGIPESGNVVPDILDETLYNLRWMLTMQDEDGGVYHKLTTRAFEPFIMPESAVENRYVVQKSTAAALNFTATMAHAAAIFASFSEELPGLADSCSEAALASWKWSMQNPDVIYIQPEDISTGEYGDKNIRDEWFWAAAEMSLMSGSAYPDSLLEKLPFSTPTWNNVLPLGIISTLLKPEKISPAIIDKCNNLFFNYADLLAGISDTSAYRVSIDHFAWGSNSDVANQGLLKMIAYRLRGDKKYLQSALNDMNYITGVNPTGYCFITGFGEKSPRNIHHRVSGADSIPEPVPGFLAGGPNLATMEDCPDLKRNALPALSYIDEECSYSTNEIAINWNAPLVFLSGALSWSCQ